MPKTLLNFFSPKSVKKEGNTSSSPYRSSTPLRPKNSVTPSKKNDENDSMIKFMVPASPSSKPDFKVTDLAWAKLEGYPWWPSIVFNDPIEDVHLKKIKKLNHVHVQFFDVPITHAWVDMRFVKKYKLEEKEKYLSDDPGVVEATKKADAASEMTCDERMKLLVNFENLEGEMEDDSFVSEQSSLEDHPGKRPRRQAAKKARKRRKIVVESDEESVEEFDPAKEIQEESEDEEEEVTLSSDPETGSEPDESPEKIPRKRKRAGSEVNLTTPHIKSAKDISTPTHSLKDPARTLSRTPLVCQQTKARLSMFQSSDHEVGPTEVVESNKYLHETLDFLFPENMKDKLGRNTNDPEYDPKTLKIPDSFWKKLTPAMYQWWKMKENNFDVVMCFKIGKFYELYHMDAVIGVKELGLIYMKGNFAHSGFPEITFGRYSNALVQKGYKVARVEQTETPKQNAERIKATPVSRQEKTLRREICRIVTRGTQILGTWTGNHKMQSSSNFLLAVIERPLLNNSNSQKPEAVREFGICFIDTSVGTFHLGQFTDDRHCSTLCTMLSCFTPSQILHEKRKLSWSLMKILQSGLSSTMQEALLPGSQFWDSAKTIKRLSAEAYFMKDDREDWPQVLLDMMYDKDSVSLTALKEYELAFSSLGACVYYLKKCLIDFEILSMGQFERYIPVKSELEHKELTITTSGLQQKTMILDSVTLANLEILENSNGGIEGTLLERLDRCQTPFGKRLLKQWICAPPCDPDVSSDRLDAIDDLASCPGLLSEARDVLKNVPDLERMLTKIHTLSKGSKKSDHPDNRAILYEEEKYSKKKIEDFLLILEHYEAAYHFLKKFQTDVSQFNSNILKRTLGIERNESENRSFPNLEDVLNQWKKAFNHKKARETGKIIPNQGTNPEYDQAFEEIERISCELDDYLKGLKKLISCSALVFKGTGKKRYQIEMPIDVANRSKLNGFVISGQRKGYKSFRTAETEKFLKEIEEAESKRDAAQSDSMAIVFREFDRDYRMWNTAVQCLATFDVLLSMTEYSKKAEGDMCRPVVIYPGEGAAPYLDIHLGKHPCMTQTFFGDDFIPNDTMLGDSANHSARCLVLTGPNMGGKSTLMRQTGLIVILSHLGCYVPAESCQMTAVDRVFTRLGASDRILAGESTFYVELSETSSILKHATEHSLILLDELGRGTSTHDGMAIALAVVKEIANNIRSRTIFSTHYHTVVDELSNDEHVKQGHMACMVGNENVDDTDPTKEMLTFLYKLIGGPCPKSYGFHAARLADVPEAVILLARKKAAELESNCKKLTAFSSLLNVEHGSTSCIKNILHAD